MTVFQFTVGALATWRLTILVSRDLGPGRVFQKLRKLSPTWLGCVFCFSITAALLVCGVLFLSGIQEKLGIWILAVLSFSAITIALHRAFTSDWAPK